MAPVNFDNEIKKTLEERRLTPSADAWSKLESRLDDQPSKTNASKTWWLAAAASLIAIAWFWFNNNSETTATEKQQVEIQTSPIKTETTSKEDVLFQEEIAETELNTVAEKEIVKEDLKTKSPKEEQIEKHLVPTQEAVVAVISENDNEATTSSVQEKSLEQQQIEAVVAQMKAIDSTDHWSIENEVDALLAEAQRNIKLEKLYNKALNAIDSNALLEEVEDDLDQSFRTKVFEALKSSYKTVKTAVAERNN